MDECIRRKVEELVGDGVRKVEEMQQHIMFPGQKPPPLTYKRFNPTYEELYNAMYSSLKRTRLKY